ncbi:choice-of-anchor D domain-containing protein [Rubrivivax sp. A210]|uniref:choice-of-anchor D domain-containing protein n=1 Tax=Rubrivivax sp. A210 TaxID=2772301 RepID=UPI00191AC045|nr:choice-of-anchor D domain-containing protein [Rubrivivax sp. A210]
MNQRRLTRRLTPIALAAALALGPGGLNAAVRSFSGPGSFWDVVANWTGGIVPGAADDALLGAFNTEVRTTFTILSFSGTGTLTVNGGTLTTSAASTTAGFTLSGGGTLAGTGAVTISGAGSWTGGFMSGTGVTTSTGSFAFSGAGLKDLIAGRTLATAGTTTWTNTAADNGRIRTGNGATINNSGSWDDQQAFSSAISPDFSGTANFNNSGSYTKSGAGTTTISIAFNNTSSGAGTGVVAVNAGGLRLLGGGSSSGSFAALAGTTLAFGGGATLLAASSINSAGTVEFAGSGNNTVAGSYSATTSSVFSGGTTTFTGNVGNVGNLVANGGAAVFNNAQAVNSGSVTLSSGSLAFNNTGGLAATTLALSGGTLAGTSTASFSGNGSWTSGTMTGAGRTQVAGAMTISGASSKDLTSGRTLGTAGTTTWTNTAADNGRIRTGGAAVIDNTGSWLDQQAFNGGIGPDFSGSATFVNSGSYTKSGAGNTTISIAFNNNSASPTTGVVAVHAGSLRLTGGGSSNGSFTGLAGTTLGLGGGHALLAASSVSTAGTVDFTGGSNTIAGSFNAGTATQFSGGTSTFSGTVSGVGSTIVATGGTGVFNITQAFSVSALQLSSGGLSFNNTGGVTTATLSLTGGTLGGTATVTVSGATTWTSGTMTGSGRTQADGTLVISGAALKDMTDGRNLVAGDTTWTNTAAGNGRIRTGGTALITNTGTWADQQAFDSSISPDFGGSGRFDNQGVYTKSGVGTTSMGVAFDNTTTGAGTGVVSVNAGTLALNGGGSSDGRFQGTGTLVFGSGVYNLLTGSSVVNPNVQFSGGTTNVGGSYSVAGTTTVNGGTANFTGTVAGSGGSLILSSGTANFNNLAGVSVATLALSGGTLSGTQDLAVSGATTWTNGTMTGTGRTLANGTLVISGAALKDMTGGRRLVAGNTTWTNTAAGNGRIRTGGTALITNTGTWADQQAFDSSISPDFGGTARFDNQGVYNKTGAGTTTISVAFDNTRSGAGTGVVNVNAGTLSLGGGGSSNGSFQGPGLLVFSGGVHDLLAASSVTNPNVQFSGGTTHMGGSYNVSGTTTVNGGTANFIGTVANSGGNLVVSSGTVNYSNLAGVTVSALTLSGGTVGGTQALTVSGNTGWTSGTMTGTGSTTLQGALSLSGAIQKDLTGGRVLNTQSTTTWTNTAVSNGRIRTGGGAVINNSGSWLDQQAFNGQISPDFGGISTFNNTGSYTKSGAATTDMAVAFVNGNATPGTGLVNLNAGTLQLSAGGSSLGTFNVADGTTLDFTSGTYTLGGTVASGADGRVRVSGGTVNTSGVKSFAGLLELGSGTLNVNADASAARYSQSTFGTLGGTGNLAISGSAVWTVGTMTGPGSTTSNGTLTLSGAGLKDLTAGRTLNTAGTTTWTNTANANGRIRTGGAAVINNSGSWLDQQAFNGQISPDFGAGGSFNNTGSYTKSGAATTDLAVAFVNGNATPGTGVVNLNAGTLQLSGGGSSLGTFNVVDGTTLAFSGGTYTLGGTVASGANGRVLVSGGVVNTQGSKSFAGLLELSGGTLNVNAAASAASYLQSVSSTLGGTGNLTLSGSAVWTAGTMTGPGSTTSSGTLALSGAGLKDLTAGRTLNTAGTTTWTNTANSNGRLRTGGAVAINNSGDWLDQQAFNGSITPDLGAGGSFNNSGSYAKTGTGTTDISVAFSNPGRLSVSAGQINLTGGLSNFAGSTLTGGTFEVIGNSTLRITGANIVTNAATLLLDGAGSALLNATSNANALAGFNTNTAAGSFSIRNGRNFTSAGAFGNAGIVSVGAASTFTAGSAFTNQVTAQLQLAGGSFAGPSLANAGVTSGFGSVAPVVSNSGTVRANGGMLTLAGGVLGATGTVQVDAGATMSLGAGSSARNLVHNGTQLALGASNITVFNDYDNASFGVGNAFDRRAGVSGSGQILASGTAQQTLNGALVSGGDTASATLTLPNIRVGLGGLTTSFTINNVGLGGPLLRGALVTTGISNPGLTGSGVTAQNWGAVSQFGPGQTFSVHFDPSVGQALAGQVLQVVNNFDNVAGQTLAITGQAFNLASASAATPSPVVLANQRVGGTATQALTISNTAAADGFSEGLNASIAASGAATAGGSFSVLAAGASSNALFVGVDTSTAGAKSGVASISLASDGTGTSGFGALGIAGQAVNVSGNVFRLAQANGATPNPVFIVNQRVGDSATQALSITNTAAADGFSERLNASIVGNGNVVASGSFSLLAAGATDNTSLLVSLDTRSAGARGGTATLTLVSDGTGTSGLGVQGLGTQTVTVNGGVYRLATASPAAPNPVLLANQRIGGTLTQVLTLSNTALADGFSEGLNASIAAGGAATAGGSFSVLAAGASSSALFVGLDTSSAGAKSGTATITLASDGTGTSGFGALGMASQTVNVSGNVFRLANPVVDTSPVTLVARVGDTAPSRTVAVSNAGADAFTERLDAGWASAPAAFSGQGAVVGLVNGQSSSALAISLNTASAGSFAGTAQVALVSSGAGTTGAADAALGSAGVAVTGRVYAPAVARVDTPALDFGIVRVGDVVAARSVTVSNTATGTLADTLSATLGGAPAPFSAGGSLAGLVAGGSHAAALTVQLDTRSAGVFSGSADLAFTSQNPELADLALASGRITLSAQVNHLAEVALAKAGGAGAFSGGGLSYTLDFGTLVLGAGPRSASLTLSNAAFGPADALAGSWDVSAVGAGDAFSLAGFGSFSGLAAGSSLSGLTLSFAGATAGSFDRVLMLQGLSTNGSGPDLALGRVELHLVGSVAAVPEPGTWLLMAGGLLALAGKARRGARANAPVAAG